MPDAMVLAAGLGTRLRPLTDELPKPLVPIGDRPLLAHLAGFLAAHGFSSAVVNLHHLSDIFIREIGKLSFTFRVVREPEIRGTAGGVAGARELFESPPIVVCNGDILAEPPVTELVTEALSGDLVLAVTPRPKGQGTVGIDRRGRVVRLRGERFGEEVAGGDYIGAAGIGARALSELPRVGCLIGDVALPELRRGGSVRCVVRAVDWTDIGSLSAYLNANLVWLERRAERAWLGTGAELEPSVELERALVGAGARVSGRGLVERSVIWPGARAEAPLADAVVTTSGRVIRVR